MGYLYHLRWWITRISSNYQQSWKSTRVSPPNATSRIRALDSHETVSRWKALTEVPPPSSFLQDSRYPTNSSRYFKYFSFLRVRSPSENPTLLEEMRSSSSLGSFLETEIFWTTWTTHVLAISLVLDQKTITTQVNGNVLDIDSGRGVNMATLNQVWTDGCLVGSDWINGYPPVN